MFKWFWTIFSLGAPESIKNSRQFLLLWTDISQKTVGIWCPWDYTFFFVIYLIFSLQINIFVSVACLLERNCRMRFMGPYLIRFYTAKKTNKSFPCDVWPCKHLTLVNLSQKLISISHRLFLTVSYNNKPRQRHWLEGKKDAVSVISKDSLPTLNTNKTLHDFFMTVR